MRNIQQFFCFFLKLSKLLLARDNLFKTIRRRIQIKIDKLEINEGAALAPMAGVADRAFREICTEFGAAYVVGEMVSAKGVSMGDRKSAELLSISEKERPAAVQLFGSEPETIAAALLAAMKFEPDMIDINMGCPAPKVTSNGCGAALMKQPETAQKIVEQCVKVSPVPVTVKFRSGWDSESINAVELAKRLEQAGAAALCVHGRTRMQMYAPPLNFEIIREVKQSVKIPVIANGDVCSGKTALELLQKTGCDFVMVGRGALGRPWVFSQIKEYMKSGETVSEPPIAERMQIMLEHIKKLCEYKGDYIGMREARKHSAWYTKGIRGAAAYRQEIFSLTHINQLEELAQKIVLSESTAE